MSTIYFTSVKIIVKYTVNNLNLDTLPNLWYYIKMKWTEKENQLILDLKNTKATYLEMVKYFSGRSQRAIAVQAAKLTKGTHKDYKWSEEQIKALIDCRIKGMQYKDAVKVVGRNLQSLKQKGSDLLNMAREYDLDEYDCAWHFLKLYYDNDL